MREKYNFGWTDPRLHMKFEYKVICFGVFDYRVVCYSTLDSITMTHNVSYHLFKYTAIYKCKQFCKPKKLTIPRIVYE